MQNPGNLIDEEGQQFHVSAETCTCKPVVSQISSQDHTTCQLVFGTTFTGTAFLETGAWNLVWQRSRKLFHYVATYIKCTTFVPAALPLVIQCVGLNSWWQFFGNIPSILIQSSASISPRAIHSSLRSPCLWEQPKCATDTELITTDLVQCAYPWTTGSSAALQKSRPSESWMWFGTKDVALKICSSYSELRELTQKCIFSLIRQFMASHKLKQCSKSKIWYLEIDEMWKPIISSLA